MEHLCPPSDAFFVGDRGRSLVHILFDRCQEEEERQQQEAEKDEYSMREERMIILAKGPVDEMREPHTALCFSRTITMENISNDIVFWKEARFCSIHAIRSF